MALLYVKYIFLDAEYNGTSEREMNLVSIAAVVQDGATVIDEMAFWLHGRSSLSKKAARAFFRGYLAQGAILVSYALEAEIRALMALFGDDDSWFTGLRGIDLYLEYRCLLNHNHELAYGRQYRGGQVIFTKPPPNKWERTKEDDLDSNAKPSYSLAAASFKLLGVKVDTAEKEAVRRLIIDSTPGPIEAARERILDYNLSDIRYLPELFVAMQRQHWAADGEPNPWSEKAEYLARAFERADYAVRTARMVRLGYPINTAKVANFTHNVEEILKVGAEECLRADPELKAFRWNKVALRFSAVEKNIRSFIVCDLIQTNRPYWRKTETGALSLSRDAFRDWYDSDSQGFAGAYCRYLKTKQSLNGFMPATTGSGKSQFNDYVGSDGRVRPYFGIYGSQSSRSQPGATGFIPLKAHWMRNFLEAPRGRALASIDYSSQEFLIAAVLSQDRAMLKAYASGDVYLAFAKEAGLVPKEATKGTHGRMREVCKACVLGISYDMSASGLAPRLSQAAKTLYTEEDAQRLIRLFYETYSAYADWKDEIQDEYRREHRLTLPDGWIMWGDNDNRRSVGNFPVQGHGAVIMRKAVRNAQDRGLDVLFTLHDSLYIEFDSGSVLAVKSLIKAMTDAYESVMQVYGEIIPIRTEGEAWSLDWRGGYPEKIEGVKYLLEYEDEKGKKDLEQYKRFFELKK